MISDIDAKKTGPEILDSGSKLLAMADLGNKDGAPHLISARVIKELCIVMKTMEYQYADPAIRALQSLPVLEDYLLEDNKVPRFGPPPMDEEPE